MITKRRLRYIEDKFDRFLNGLFKEGEMLEIRIKPTGNSSLEVTFKDVSERGGEREEAQYAEEQEELAKIYADIAVEKIREEGGGIKNFLYKMFLEKIKKISESEGVAM